MLEHLEEKGTFIIKLKQDKFDYYNVAQHNPDKVNNEKALKDKLMNYNEYDVILCSSDTLKKEQPDEWERLNSQLYNRYKENRNLRILYADFSYCSLKLFETFVLSTNKRKREENTGQQNSTSPTTVPKVYPPPPALTDNVINILLLGESGVGKSTFINAFVNYLKFKTFEQAQANDPVVLIPVSFLITTGHNFDEHMVKFGEPDELNNEDFDHAGQSVTQHCKSYVFSLNRTDENKLCIIDTPGFGDTRGFHQDELNMQHILEYIHKLTHLKAVCFLLRPNTSQINNFFPNMSHPTTRSSRSKCPSKHYLLFY